MVLLKVTAVNPYSPVDRLLHDVAFRTLWAQQAVGEMENRLYRERLSRLEITRPVFITALPRAGTTLLLEVLNSLSEFSSHTYRDMPFVLCPLVWNRLSRRFQVAAHSQQRAHRDGMTISYDSPEAFEEVVWRRYWPDKYQRTHIEVWGASDANLEFEQFFQQHIRKIIALRGRAAPSRYLSKNNANMARLDVLLRIFPDVTVLIPFRNPYAQASSLLRQHLQFLERHARDPFAARYMMWLGHYEFGRALRPVNFDSWIHAFPGLDPRTRDFWLAYWVRTYTALARHTSPNIHFVNYDAMCRQPELALTELAKVINVDVEALLAQAPRFRAPTEYGRQCDDKGPYAGEALQVLERLERRSIH